MHTDSLHIEAIYIFVVSFHLVWQPSCVNYSYSSAFMRQRKHSYKVDHLSASCFTLVLSSLKILAGRSSLILEFTLFLSSQKCSSITITVVIRDVLYVTVNSGFKGIEGGGHYSLHRCQLMEC